MLGSRRRGSVQRRSKSANSFPPCQPIDVARWLGICSGTRGWPAQSESVSCRRLDLVVLLVLLLWLLGSPVLPWTTRTQTLILVLLQLQSAAWRAHTQAVIF